MSVACFKLKDELVLLSVKAYYADCEFGGSTGGPGYDITIPGPWVCSYNSTRMVCQWSMSDFTIVNLFVVDYQTGQKLVKINHYEISDGRLWHHYHSRLRPLGAVNNSVNNETSNPYSQTRWYVCRSFKSLRFPIRKMASFPVSRRLSGEQLRD